MVFFRADSNKQIASGHIMRCISIAQAFKDAGEDVTFLIADENPILMLERAEMKYHNLHSVWNQLMDEIEAMKSLLQCYDKPLLVIDTYQVSRDYVEALLPYAKICYLGSKPEYLGPIQALINYSTDIDYNFYNNNYKDTTKLLLGASYAPLRKEFLEVKHKQSIDGKCRVLLTTGNTDARNCVSKILSILTQSNASSLEIHVVVGAMFDAKEQLHQFYDGNPMVVLHENVKSMSGLMAISDLAISANGTTVYELAAAQVPVISFAMVGEQVQSARKLSELGVVEYCGEIYSNTEDVVNKIVSAVLRLANYSKERQSLRQKAYSVIDGRGCQRIVEELKNI